MASGTALLVLDMQNDICDFHGRNEHLNHFIAAVKKAIDWARAAKIPVIYSRVAYRTTYIDALPLMAKMMKERNILNETTRGGAIVDELAPQADDVMITRRRVSAFYNTDLELVLRALKINTLLYTGMSTARVVESTARDASDRDFRNIIISDGCAADTQEKHENALKAIGDFFGEVKTLDEVKKALA